jgi:predicted NUDIX family phosphoesterase
MSSVDAERVLVVPTELFREVGYFQGFRTEVEPYLRQLLQGQHTSYRSRGEMEQDPTFKQLIPYVVFRYLDPAGEIHVFSYRRGKGQGEKRLQAKLSIGVGGHISTTDHRDNFDETYSEGMRRELDEEVTVSCVYRERVVGMINDDDTDVGRVHLGIVHLADVDAPAVFPKEAGITEARFTPFSELMNRLEEMESWSRICLEGLHGCGWGQATTARSASIVGR